MKLGTIILVSMLCGLAGGGLGAIGIWFAMSLCKTFDIADEQMKKEV